MDNVPDLNFFNLPEQIHSLKLVLHEGPDAFGAALQANTGAILTNCGGQEVLLHHYDSDGNYVSSHGFMFLLEEQKEHKLEDLMMVEVIEESDWVKLVIRKDNLYLIGFLSKVGYHELESGETTLPQALKLKVGVSYMELLKIGIEQFSKDVSTRYEPYRLAAAIRALNSKEATTDYIKPHLGIIVVMILESTRFPKIEDAIINGGREDDRNMPMGELSTIVHDWDNQSKCLNDFKNGIESGENPATLKMVGYFRTVAEAAIHIKAIHRSQDKKLRVKSPGVVKKGNSKKTWKGQSSGTK